MNSIVINFPLFAVADQIPLHAFPHPEKEKERFLMWVKAVGSFQVQSVMNDIANIVTVGAQVNHAIPSSSSGDKLYNVCKIPDCLKDHTYYNTVNLEDQQPTLHADSGKLSAGMTGVLQQIENTFNSVIKPPCNKRRPDSKDISPTDQNACDSVVKHNEPPSKNRRTDSYDTTPTDQGKHFQR
ncbi:hypothetical protein O0L34_g16759 [Tuta absoluta]|nr:hypothetical protein O0L34_g16759 [Tuta absoluta]